MSASSAGYAEHRRWLLDAKCWPNRVFVPMDDNDSPIFGINFMGDWPPGNFFGVVHADGIDACDAFIDDHLVELSEWLSQNARVK